MLSVVEIVDVGYQVLSSKENKSYIFWKGQESGCGQYS